MPAAILERPETDEKLSDTPVRPEPPWSIFLFKDNSKEDEALAAALNRAMPSLGQNRIKRAIADLKNSSFTRLFKGKKPEAEAHYERLKEEDLKADLRPEY